MAAARAGSHRGTFSLKFGTGPLNSLASQRKNKETMKKEIDTNSITKGDELRFFFLSRRQVLQELRPKCCPEEHTLLFPYGTVRATSCCRETQGDVMDGV